MNKLLRFSTAEQTFFAKRLSFLIKAGVPLVECLNLIRSQTKSKAKKQIFTSVIEDVSNGQFLSTSLAKFGRLFGDFSVSLIRVGETTGVLTQNLAYLADELQKKQVLQRKVIGALSYPIFITLATVGITIALTAYIFPKLMPIFSSLQIPLPFTTRALINTSGYLEHWGLLTAVVFLALLAIFLGARARFEPVRLVTDRASLRVPIIGRLVRAYTLTSFCRTLGLLLKSGLMLTEALAITGETLQNRSYRLACVRITTLIARGEPISRALSARPDLFPDMLVHLIAIGERTGNLSQTFVYLGEHYESEVDTLTKGFSSAIEPVLMIFMGLLVGLIAVSVILPIYQITQYLRPV